MLLKYVKYWFSETLKQQQRHNTWSLVILNKHFQLDHDTWLIQVTEISVKSVLICHHVTVLLQDFICEHYGEDSSLYDKEIKELMELRQVNNSVDTTSYSTNFDLLQF